MKNIRYSYSIYKTNTANPVDIKTFLLINYTFMKFVIEKISQGFIVSLPEKMGTISVIGKKQKLSYDAEGNVKGLAPDWVKTKKYRENNPESKKIIYHTNNHTNNYRYKTLWSKINVLVKNKSYYSLQLARANKRLIHKCVVEGVDFITK